MKLTKILAMVMALVCVFAMSTTAFAAGSFDTSTAQTDNDVELEAPADADVAVYGYVGEDATISDTDPADPDVAPTVTASGTVVSVSVPVKVIWAAFASDGGEVTAPAYKITNKSAFALDVTLVSFNADATDDNTAVDDKLTLNITGDEMAASDVVGITSSVAYDDALAVDGVWNFSFAGEYTGDFGTAYTPSYAMVLQFDLH